MVDGEDADLGMPSPDRDDAASRLARRAQRRAEGARYYQRVGVGAILPGAGLVRSRWQILGWFLIGLALLSLIGVVVLGAQGRLINTALTAAVEPRTLRVLAAVVAGLGLVWVASIVLTARTWWPEDSRRRWTKVGFATLAALVIAAPSALAVQYLGVQASLVDTVVVEDDLQPAGGGPSAGASDPWAGISRINLALLGSDSGADRVGVRTDSMMVVSINPQTGDTLLIGVPRNLENVPFPASNPLSEVWPQGYNCGDECLMNGVWTVADDRPDLFPDDPRPGLTTTLDVLGEITGLELDRYVIVDLKGFEQLVDAMGGVDINVTERVCTSCKSGSYGGVVWTTEKQEWIEPGYQHLDGYHALWYARSRAGSDDFSRMRRQRCVAGALLEQADPVSMFARYPRIAAAVADNVSVGIPQSDLPSWVDLVERIQKGKSIRSLPLTNNVIDPGNPDFAAIRTLVNESLVPPPPVASPAASPSASSSAPAPSESPQPSPSTSPSVDDSAATSISATC